MKKQVVAVMLSLAMCTSTAAEASIVSAAEFSSEELSVDTETESEESPVADDSAAVADTEDATDAEDVTDAEVTVETDDENSNTVQNDGEAADDQVADFSAEDTTDVVAFEDETQIAEATADEVGAKVNESANEHEACLLYTRWEPDNAQNPTKWKLKKLSTPKTQEAQDDTAVVGTETAETEPAADETVSAEENIDAAAQADTETQTDAVDTAEAAEQDADTTADTTDTADVQQDADTTADTTDTADVQQEVDTQTAEETGEACEYYTAADGLMKITTLNSDGSELFTAYYAFDKDGYLLTGRNQVGDNNIDYYYFLTSGEVKVSNTLNTSVKTPYNSKLGQMITKEWRWNAKDGVFNYYAPKQEYFVVNRTYKINGVSYYLLKGGKPYVGDKTISGAVYYFRPAASSKDIPGKMASNGWFSKNVNNNVQWRYFDANGRYQKKGIGAYKVKSNDKRLYLLDANGYLIRSKKMVKGADRYYSLADGNGVAYTNKLVKYGRYRYYFVGNGRRATWKNRWVKLTAVGNRYYYFGKTPGCVQEQKGIKKVTVNGKFVGWFNFPANGNHLKGCWSGNRYYLADGRMASGVTKIGSRYYFFQRSSTTAYKGLVYKSKWIKYNNKYYFACSTGVLADNGWRRIKMNGTYYYFLFKNCTAVTNKSGVQHNGTYGSLDSMGRFVTAGWVIVNNSRNLIRYMDPKTGKYVKSTVRMINGVQYRFDKNGYRVNDRTNEFKQSSYYLTCDRVNGVMTVYTNSRMTIPIKTIRVSVGKAGTDTPKGTFTLRRSARWQPLMGPSWGQYGTNVVGGIFVHSVACSQMNDHNLPVGEYLKLGNPASHGCIRCCVADAKWVYDNCNGSRINIFDGKYTADETKKGPLGRKAITPLRGNYTFDPTDPAYAGR